MRLQPGILRKGELKWCVFGNQLCGFRPSGGLHIGHYFAVIEPGQQGADVLVANYHAPELSEPTVDLAVATLKRFGVKSIKLQRDVFNSELYFKLLSLAAIGDLNRMTQYRGNENKTAQLLTYPVLMAHDCAGYSEILVGDDQEQHLNYARKLLRKYEKEFGEIGVPRAKVVAGRVKDLRHPERKMSKSEPSGCLFLDDTPDRIRRKIRKATMDEEGTRNLHFLYSKFVGGEVPETNVELKDKLTEAIVRKVSRLKYKMPP